MAYRAPRSSSVTLHQPRSDIYNELDNVVVLAKGGNVAYSGPRTELGPVLADAGYPIPPLFNPADHLLDTISRPKQAAELIQFWRGRQTKLLNPIGEKTTAADLVPIDASVLESTRRSTPAHIAMSVVIQRMVKNLWRQQPSKSRPLMTTPCPHSRLAVFWLRLQVCRPMKCLLTMK